MIETRARTRGRAASSGGMFFADPAEIDLDTDAQQILARLGATVCPFSPIDHVAHVRQIAAVALDAKRHPKNAYARRTL